MESEDVGGRGVIQSLAHLLSGKSGPTAWCNTCHRKHPRRGGCGLQKVTRIAKSGREVTRWAHVPPKQNKKKSKARKS